MGINQGLASVSGDFMIAALLIYSLAVLAFAGDLAFGKPRRASAARAGIRERAWELAAVGAGGSPAVGEAVAGDPADGGPVGSSPAVAATLPSRRVPFFRALREAGLWTRLGVALSLTGATAHLVAVVTRGFAAHRAPWGNMYEFVTALTCIAAIFFMYVMIRYRAWVLGIWVMGAVVIALGLAETVIYTAAGPLVPALQSYWLSIHVTAMTLSSGIFFFAAVLGILYLVAGRYQARVGTGKAVAGSNGLLARIPSAAQLDKLTYRTVVFGFPVWTFGVIAGAIWADEAWGRYWGWDPVETWAFITWVLYAAYLHARATAGFRRWAHYIQLLGFASLVVNMLVIQTFVTGMHSYAGVNLWGLMAKSAILSGPINSDISRGDDPPDPPVRGRWHKPPAVARVRRELICARWQRTPSYRARGNQRFSRGRPPDPRCAAAGTSRQRSRGCGVN